MKKNILIVIIVAILALSTLLLTACGTKMFPINEERAGKQVTATVNYADREAIVSVDEVYNQFYSYYNYLYSYYSYGYITAEQFQSYLSDLDETFASYNKSLAKSSLYNLLCIETMSKYYQDTLAADDPRLAAMQDASTKNHTYKYAKMADLERYYDERVAELVAILSCHSDYSYVNSAIRSANEDLQSRFDSYLETVRAEYAALESIGKDTTPSGFVSISVLEKPYRLIYEVDSNATLDTTGMIVVANYEEETEEHGKTVVIPNKYVVTSGFSASSAAEDQVITVTYAQKTATFTVDIVTARPTRETPAKEAEEDEKDDSVMADKFVFEIKDADYIKEGMTEEELAEATQERNMARNAMSRLNNYLKTNYRNYNYYFYSYLLTQVRALTQATKEAEIALTQAELDTEYDRIISERKAELAVKDFAKSDIEDVEKSLLQPTVEGTYGYYYVSQVLFKFTDEQSKAISAFKSANNANETAIQHYTVNKAKEIGVYLSNLDYDKSATCELEECTCPHCKNYVVPDGAERPSFTTLDQWYSCSEDCECVACPAKKYQNTEAINVMDIIEGENGIQASLDAVNNDADITADAFAYREKLLEVINDWIYQANEDSGAFTNITDKKYGYLMTPETESSGMVEAFELACDTLAAFNGVDVYNGETFDEAKARLAEKGVFITSNRGGVGSYAWCVSEYGIHFVVLTAYATDFDFGTVGTTQVGQTDYDQLGLDYIYSSYDYDSSEAASLPVKQADGTIRYYSNGTVGAHIGAELLSEKVSADYANFQKDFITQYEDTNIKYNEKGYQYLLKQLQESDE